MQIYVASFAPHDDRAAVGGYEYRYTLSDAASEYELFVRELKDTHRVRLVPVTLPVEVMERINAVIIDYLEENLEGLEVTFGVLQQHIPS